MFLTIKLFIKHQLHLGGVRNTGCIKKDIKQLFNNIKWYGIIDGAICPYIFNSNINTLFYKNYIFPNGKKANIIEVLFRILDIRAFYKTPVIVARGKYYNTIRTTPTAKEIIMYLIGKENNISHAMFLNIVLKSS